MAALLWCLMIAGICVLRATAEHACEENPSDHYIPSYRDNSICYVNGKRFHENHVYKDSSFWYRCVKGSLEARGCTYKRTEDNADVCVDFGERFRTSTYAFKCEKTSRGYRTEAFACVHDGREIAVGGDFADDSYWYRCALEEDMVVRKIIACIDEHGSRVPIGCYGKERGYLHACERFGKDGVWWRNAGLKGSIPPCVQSERLEIAPPAHRVGECATPAGEHVPDGERVDIGTQWFECRRGTLVVNGCLDVDEHGHTTRLHYGEQDCRRHGHLQVNVETRRDAPVLDDDDDDDVDESPNECIHHLIRYSVGSMWSHGNYTLTCIRQSGKPTIKVVECTDEHGHAVQQDYAQAQGLDYKCRYVGYLSAAVSSEPQSGRRTELAKSERTQRLPLPRKSSSSVTYQVQCCVKGGCYEQGETFTLGQFRYLCTDRGSQAKQCVTPHGDLVSHAQTYRYNGYVFRCELERNQASQKVIACIDENGVERQFGERWTIGESLLKFDKECQSYDGGARVELVACAYDTKDGGKGSLDPGCYRHVGQHVIACSRLPSGALNIEYAPRALEDSITGGLAFC